MERNASSEWSLLEVLVHAGLPAIVILPYALAPVPKWFYADREIAGYFQALAYWREPIAQLLYNTPAENLSSLHLHSLLSAPLVGLGIPQGGRIVSLGAGVIAVLLVAHLAARLYSPRVGVIAAAMLWLQPLYWFLAGGFMPETLSIALTTGSVVACLHATGERSRAYFALALALYLLALTVHLWEGVIVAVLAAILVTRREWLRLRILAYVTVVGGLGIWVLTHLQPTAGDALVRYAVWSDLSVLWSLDRFWLRWLRDLHPLSLYLTAVLPAAIAGAAVAGYRWLRTRSLRSAVVASWFVAGLSIPLLLANGLEFHQYYAWALLVPIAMGLAVAIDHAIDRLGALIETPREAVVDRAARGAMLGVTVLAIVSFQSGVVAAPNQPLDRFWGADGSIDSRSFQTAGETLAGYEVTPEETVFVGDWGFGASNHIGQYPRLGQVLVYTDWLIRTRVPDGETVRLVENRSAVGDRDWIVELENGTATVYERP